MEQLRMICKMEKFRHMKLKKDIQYICISRATKKCGQKWFA